MYGSPVHFTTPRDARAAGIAAVFQDLALAPLLSVWRNFFLGVEPMRGGVLMRSAFMKRILDEPTSALGVKQSGVVLKYTRAAAERGLGVIFITHNPNHAIPVGDRFLLLNRGHSLGDFAKDEISRTELTRLMAGGAELEQLEHEIGIR